MDKSKKATRKAKHRGGRQGFRRSALAVKDSEVVEMKTLGDIIRHLGPLAGASAEVTRGTVAGPHNLAEAFAFVKFADGTLALERKAHRCLGPAR